MTFDGRARRAVQGIHRAVEVMEMSSTKTPNRLSRFDQYRERKSKNQRIVALIVGIAVPLALLVGAVRWLGTGGDSRLPATPPPGSVAPSQPATPTVVSGRSRDVFKAPFMYTVPADWHFSGQGDRYVSFETPGAFGTDVIVLSSVVASASDCSMRPAQGVGTSSEAITHWLATHPALDATTPQPVTLGAATGSYVDIQLASDWNGSCPQGPTLVTGQPDDPQNWGIYGAVKERFYVLDLPSGDTVTIVISDDQSESDFQSLIDEAAPVVESFRFLK